MSNRLPAIARPTARFGLPSVAPALLLIVALVTTSVSVAAEPNRALELCGQVPVRFNGRMAKLDTVARCYLRTVSDRDTALDADDRDHSAIEWFLDVIASSERAQQYRVLPIENSELQRLFGLEPRAAVLEGRRNLYSLAEILPRADEFTKEEERLRKAAAAGLTATPTDYERAVEDLGRRAAVMIALQQSFSAPAEPTIESMRDYFERLPRLERMTLPAVIPPQSPTDRWKTYARAALENIAIEITKPEGRKPNHAVSAWTEMLRAVRAGDPMPIEQAVKAYHKLIQELNVGPAGFDFQTPDGWNERGVSAVNVALPYEDTLAAGAVVASFRVDDGGRSCAIDVNYFAGATAPLPRIINQWRVNTWLAPLGVQELKSTVTPVLIGAERGALAEIEVPRHLTRDEGRRVLGAVLKRGADTFVVTMTGDPKLVAANRDKYDRFLKSLKLGAAEEVAKWFDLVEGDPTPDRSGLRVLVAVTPGKRHAWMFYLVGRGEFPASLRERFLKVVGEFPVEEGVASPEGGEAGETRLPQGWQVDLSTGGYASIQLGPAGESPVVTVYPLAGYSASCEAALLTHWRSQLDLPELSRAAAAEQWSTEEAGQREIRVMEAAAETRDSK